MRISCEPLGEVDNYNPFSVTASLLYQILTKGKQMYFRDLETSAKEMAEHNLKMKQMAADRAKRRTSKLSLAELKQRASK